MRKNITLIIITLILLIILIISHLKYSFKSASEYNDLNSNIPNSQLSVNIYNNIDVFDSIPNIIKETKNFSFLFLSLVITTFNLFILILIYESIGIEFTYQYYILLFSFTFIITYFILYSFIDLRIYKYFDYYLKLKK